MRKQQKCQYCGRMFFPKVIEVFVKKEIQCPECKEPMKNDGKTTCYKCNIVFSKEDFRKIVAQIRGTTRNKMEVAKWRETQEFFEKILIPEEQYCQKCRNYARTVQQRKINSERINKKAEKITVKAIPEEDRKIFERAEANWYIRQQIRKEHEEAQNKAREEAALKQEKEAIKKAMEDEEKNLSKKE